MFRGDSAADHAICIFSQIKEKLHQFLVSFVFGDLSQLFTTDDNGGISRVPDMNLTLQKFLDLLINALGRFLIDDENFHLIVQKSTRKANINRSFNFISGKYPELDFCHSDVLYYFADVVL